MLSFQVPGNKIATVVLGVAEGSREDSESWRNFFRYQKSRGLKKINLLFPDKSLGLVETFWEFYPDAKWQRCVVHFFIEMC